MKKLLLFLSTGLLLLGCSNDKSEDDPTPATPGGAASTLTAKVTGYSDISYSSPTGALNTDVSASRIPASDPAAAPYIMSINGGTNTRKISLILEKFKGAGIYVLVSNYNGSLATTNSGTYRDGGSAYSTETRPGAGVVQGQVVVTSYDEATRRIKGTFYFKGDNIVIPPGSPQTREVTDGAFDIRVTL